MNSLGPPSRQWVWIPCGVALLAAASVAALLLVRPPGEVGTPFADRSLGTAVRAGGSLPGITWADDIHPIFVRNRCGNCHTRGREARVENLTEFSLGMIDPADPANPFYSYHELVYAAGSPARMEGETLQDGRCCWPREAAEEEKRRIWPGHPERSVLLRKLERDYYGWNRPPRFLEEGLRLRWGLPMPWGHATGDDAGTGDHADAGTGGQTATGAGHGQPEPEQPSGYEEYPLPSWPARVLFRAGLWSGRGEEQLVALPPAIPAADRMLLRRWILDAFTTPDDRTALELRAVDTRGQPLAGAPIELIGNYTSPTLRQVEDRRFLTADGEGRARLIFPVSSVVSRTWYARVAGFDAEYRKIRLAPGPPVSVDLTAPLGAKPATVPGVGPSDHHAAMAAVKAKIPAVYRAMKVPAMPVTAKTLTRGKLLFAERCSVCHGESGRGDGPAAAGLAPRPANFLDTAHSDMYGPGEKFWIVGNGIAGTAMPGFSDRLSETNRWALVSHIWTLQGKGSGWQPAAIDPGGAGENPPHLERGEHQ